MFPFGHKMGTDRFGQTVVELGSTRTLVDLRMVTFNHLGESDCWFNLSNFDGYALAFLRIRDNDDETTLYTGDAVTLVADPFDLDCHRVTLGHRWFGSRSFLIRITIPPRPVRCLGVSGVYTMVENSDPVGTLGISSA